MKFLLLMLILATETGIGFAAKHTITNSGLTFSPDTITIDAGDTVVFSLGSAHNAVEVGQATYNSNGNTSNGGFSVPFGGGTVVFKNAGNFYYVCEPHASMGMKGLITVTVPTGLQELSSNGKLIEVYPNPAQGPFIIDNQFAEVKISKIEIANNKGVIVRTLVPTSNQQVVDLNGYAPGLYIVSVYTDKGVVLKKVIVQ